MKTAEIIVGVLLLWAACGYILLLREIWNRMPLRWLKVGLLLSVGSSIILVIKRALHFLFGLPVNEVAFLIFCAGYALGGIIVSLAIFGHVNGHKK